MNEQTKVGLLFAILAIILIAGFLFFSKAKNEDSPPIIDTPTEEAPRFRNIEADSISRIPLEMESKVINLKDDIAISLNLPEGFEIHPAAQGLRRVRFFAKSPDKRLFVTSMYNLSDNTRGKVYILDDFDDRSNTFKKIITWKDKLRNPNSVQFYTDQNGQDWLYLAVTDSLVRYPYQAGETVPGGPAEKIYDFPGYGLNYKYGGWHLTRTLAFHEDKLYISVGSSCNLCEEKPEEPSRATIMMMNPDGSDAQVYASGLRNAVDIGWVEGKFYATNMASDHLGNTKPNDYFHQVEAGKHYGWPYCYEHDRQFFEEDPKNLSINRVEKKLVKTSWERKNIDCDKIPSAYTLFPPHSSPLGFEYFTNSTESEALRNYFLVALHGPTKPKKGRRTGHKIVRIKKGMAQEKVIDGFLVGDNRVGRPCDIIQWSDNSFFFSDDLAGIVYYVKTN